MKTPNLNTQRASVAMLLLVSNPSLAEQIPDALRGKSITVKWSESRTFKQDGRGNTSPWYGVADLYFSTKGRIFSRIERTGAPKTTTVPELAYNAGTPQWHFEGGTLVGENAFTNGARRVTVNFSDGFANCSIDVTYGKKGTEPIVIANGGELLGVTVVSKECSVKPGNLLGDQQ